jgi:hypothetical protein
MFEIFISKLLDMFALNEIVNNSWQRICRKRQQKLKTQKIVCSSFAEICNNVHSHYGGQHGHFSSPYW